MPNRQGEGQRKGIYYMTQDTVARGKISTQGRCWWLMPVILTTQEAEIRRITV
jgi:hypothetical protein